MQSIHNDKEFEKEYKEQFKNMTDEQIEQHIGLEKVRNVMEGFDENYGIDKIRKLVKEIKEEKDNEDRKELWYAIEGYVRENGLNKDGQIDFSKLKRWCETNSIQVPKALLEYKQKYIDKTD